MIKNLFREISMADVKGYNDLSENEKDLFDKMYKRHLASMDREIHLEYTEKNIVEIQGEGNGVIVYFRNGNAYRYKQNKTWEKYL